MLDPGQSVVLAHELDVERNLRTQTRVSAEPVDQDGNRVEGRDVASTVSMVIEAEDPGGLPGFQDGLDASKEVFLFIGGLFVLAAGLLPLLLLGVLALFGLRWLDRRRPKPETPTKPAWPAAAEAETEKATVEAESSEEADAEEEPATETDESD